MVGSTNKSNFRIRPADMDDVPLILSLIKELAEYEQLSHQVVASEGGLREALFGEHPVAEVVVGDWDATQPGNGVGTFRPMGSRSCAAGSCAMLATINGPWLVDSNRKASFVLQTTNRRLAYISFRLV